MRKNAVLLYLAACASFAVSPAIARDITVGLSGTVTSVDPHFYNASPNNSIAMQIFDRLTERTAEGQLVEGLATKWEAASETKWRFTLREGVPFEVSVAELACRMATGKQRHSPARSASQA